MAKTEANARSHKRRRWSAGGWSKSQRPGEKCSVVLRLTQAGKAMVTKDTWSALALTCDAVGNKTRRRMGRGLADILS